MRPHIRLWIASLYLFIMGTISLAYTLIELVLGVMYESLLIIGDALHGFMDAAIAYVSGFGLYYASRRGRSFPWEVYRLESLVTLLSVLAVLGFYTYMLVTSTRLEGTPTPLWAAPLFLAGAALTYAMYVWERRNYQTLKLTVLKADALHAKVDTILSAGFAAAVCASNFFKLFAAEMIAVIAAYCYVLYEFARLSRDATYGILGVLYRDPALEGKIREKLLSIGKPLNLKIRRAGSFLVVYALIAVSPEMTVGQLHVLRSRIIRSVMKLHPLVVHVDIKIIPKRKARKRAEKQCIHAHM
ncbi:MAG: cation diffusion facilitator family transporter [Thermoproteaceae archaeon]|nr:cation diffusion facilitator family transporter [Thermoproteaceae archaeon]